MAARHYMSHCEEFRCRGGMTRQSHRISIGPALCGRIAGDDSYGRRIYNMNVAMIKSAFYYILAILMAGLLIPDVAFADEYRDKINEGFDLYRNGEYDKAAEKFKEAGILKPEQALPDYDEGAARYKANDFTGAAAEYDGSIAKADPKLQADSYFNAGNAHLKAQQYDKAIEAYINALKIKPKDKDYQQNLELALRQMQMQMQQQQQQGQGEQNDQSQNQQNQQQQQDKKDQQQQQQAQKQEDMKEKQKQPQQSQQDDKMSEEQAQELLARFADDEKETQKRLKQVMMKGRSTNDW
jgi:tetratricopeptide (TPR) repeat protein